MKIPTNMKTPIASFVSSDASGSSSSDAIPLTGPSTPRSAAVRSDSTSLTARVSTALRSAMPGRAGASFVTPDTGRQIDRPRGSAVVQTPRTSETPAHHVGNLINFLTEPKKYSDAEWIFTVIQLLPPDAAASSALPLAENIRSSVGHLSDAECRTALQTLHSMPVLYSTEGSEQKPDFEHRRRFAEVGSQLNTALEERVGRSYGATPSTPGLAPDHSDDFFDKFFSKCGGTQSYQCSLDQVVIDQRLRDSGFG